LSLISALDTGKTWNHVTGVPQKKVLKRKADDEETIFECENVRQRIKRHVRVDGHEDDLLSCWIWIGAKRADYGSIGIQGRTWYSHKASYYAFRNLPLPSRTNNLVVRHMCLEKLCVNPWHLELGTAKDNMRDKIRDGTHTNGKQTTITAEIAKQIKESKGAGTARERAQRFNVSVDIVKNIDAGKAWKHV
jgi:hypothetical protein